MDDLLDILNKRTVPGLLIVDAGFRVLYANREALEIIPQMQRWTEDEENSALVPEAIVNVCEQVIKRDGIAASPAAGMPACEVLDASTGEHCSLRAFYIGDSTEDEPHVMVLIERLIERHEVDLAKAQKVYGLSRREVEVLHCICQGLTNREIADRKCISEYTVKDHIKSIMRSMRVSSRSEIIAALR